MAHRVESIFTDNAMMLEPSTEEGQTTEIKEPKQKDKRDIFADEPFMNVIGKEKFDERVEKVFAMIGDALRKSYGPFGATTLISQYPYYHVTKDGFTIQKNLAFDKTKSFIDQIICGLASDICGRLNYSVGDGTTTAIIATNAIFQAYRDRAETIKENRFLPRDIMKKFEEIKSYVVDYLLNHAVAINVLDKEELSEYIRKIVYISSNGDEELTTMIADLYKELKYPSITVTTASDGITKKKIIHGFRINAILSDPMYINTDEKTMKTGDCDVIVFDHKVSIDTYDAILRPLSDICKNRGRHLICLAPFYDEHALNTRISADLRAEYARTKDINLILMNYKNNTAHHKKMINNLAMLLNTEIINIDKEKELLNTMMDVLNGNVDSRDNFPFNIDNRGLLGTTVGIDMGISEMDNKQKLVLGTLTEETSEESIFMKCPEHAVRLGYVKETTLGITSSIFTGFQYDESMYNAYVEEAKRDLEEAEKKYQKLGTFNVAVSEAQERLNSLYMDIGLIEVGSDSEFSQGYLRDAVDDCVKASRSAYNYGVINGCSVSVIRGLDDYMDNVNVFVMSESEVELTQLVYEIFREGFINVYKALIQNMGVNTDYLVEDKTFDDLILFAENIFHTEPDALRSLVEEDYSRLREFMEEREVDGYREVIFHADDFIIEKAVEQDKVFDLVKGEYSDSVINSTETDIQVLKATSDLIKLLITGNQLVISQYGQFTQ